MWFSPWRRILRGKSGDTKPSGLRAGTKFVEEDTGIEYTYDPVMQDWKKKVAPYSAIVCKDGSTVWAEDSDGKTIASGEAGVDDASVIQSAIDSLPVYGSAYHEGYFGTIALHGEFTLKKTIKISKGYIRFTGDAKIWVDIPDGFAFEVFNGSDTDPEPRWVCFENLFFFDVGFGKSGLFNFKYNSDWQIRRCFCDGFKTVLRLERTWGDAQLMDNCSINGCPPDGRGIIEIATPTNDRTNSITFRNINAVQYNENACIVYLEHELLGCVFDDIFQEGKGCFMMCADGVNLKETSFISCILLANGGSLKLANGGDLSIDIIGSTYSEMELSRAFACNIKPRHLAIRDPSKPQIRILKCNRTILEVSLISVDKDAGVPVIKIGEGGELETTRIVNTVFRDNIVEKIIEVAGGSDYGLTIHNCQVYSPNYDATYSTCYFVHTTKKVTLKDVYVYNPVNFHLTNDFTKVKLENIYGDIKSKNSGTQTFDGDGTTTDFLIGDHGLVITDPSKIVVKVTPISSDAIAASPCIGYVDPADNTKIRVKFASAPASGSGNVEIVWEAQVVS